MPSSAADREILPATVCRVRRITPHLHSVTVRGPDLARFEPLGFDQALRLFLPKPGQDGLRLPVVGRDGWLAAFRAMPQDQRPRARIYTVRAFSAAAGELEIEFVVHGEQAPASRWALRARPGDRLGLLAEGVRFRPPTYAGTHLLVGEESALPAILGVLESAPPGWRADVLLEIPSTADIRGLPSRSGVDVRWLPRDDERRRPGDLALDALRALPQPNPLPTYVYLVGERRLVTDGRRHVIRSWGLDPAMVEFVGYWRYGEPSAG
ncbi:siderophore-interacting protein [Amycolatopsis ultiminotia]|uniref:Siderophore-interacting protein n=1 Tax=Amycolatopsis ultiminotia TaxID=543629 RepID=A0ABP6YJS1_9PSEU